MDNRAALGAFGALAQETRLACLRLLIVHEPAGLAAGEIARRLEVTSNTLSSHLAVLARASLVRARRNGRSIVYRADVDGLRTLVDFLLHDCCGGNEAVCAAALPPFMQRPSTQVTSRQRPLTQADEQPRGGRIMADQQERVWNVLFLCTGNSARSVMAECAVNRWGEGRFKGYSAGSQPKGEIHPTTLKLLRQLNYKTDGLYSKSWDEFAKPDAPQMDFVFTVCDSAAAEPCPVWPGQPMSAHWGVEDPAAYEGPEDKQLAYFRRIYSYLENRIKIFINLPLRSLDRLTLQRRIEAIGQATPEDASAPAVPQSA